MRRQWKKIIAALALASIAAPAFADPSQGKYGGATSVNATVTGVYPAATPSLAPGGTSNLTLDQHGNLNVNVQAGAAGSGGGGAVYPLPSSSPFNVNCVSGCTIGGSGTSGVFPAPSTSPFPVTAATTLPVSGNFYPATQPVSIATTVPVSLATTVPVSGSFYQSVQPVSFPTSQPVFCTSGCSGSGGLAAQYNSSPPIYSSGSNATLQTTANGYLDIVAATPLPLQPVTLSVPSPIPVTAATTLPVSIATTVPVSVATTLPVAQKIPGTIGTYYYAGATSSGAPVTVSAGSLLSVVNTSQTNQGVEMICYNNASTASGNILWAGTLTAGQVITFGPWGVFGSAGVFCQPTGATNSGNGINFVYMYQ